MAASLFQGLNMKALKYSLLALLLPCSIQAAVTVDEFPSGCIYSSVNSDGVSFFTDIEPPELRASLGASSSVAQIIQPRAKVVSVKASTASYNANPVAETQESSQVSDQLAEAVAQRED